MKLGVAYNAFVGLDLLKPSLLNIRPHCSYVVVVYSTVSNLGRPGPEYAEDLLNDLKREGLVNCLYKYTPIITSPTPLGVVVHNRRKREIGRELCAHHDCDYYLCRDCDEFHDPEQLRWALDWVGRSGCDLTLCRIQEYVKSPLFQSRSLAGFFVPFVHKSHLPYSRTEYRKWRIDPARHVIGFRAARLFEADEIVMHHMTRVRFDDEELDAKYGSHSWFDRAHDVQRLIAGARNPDPNEYRELGSDQFGILDYWRNEFGKWKGKTKRTELAG